MSKYRLFLIISLICCFLSVNASFDDESESFLFCADDEFKCTDGERCIWKGLLCDLIPDCIDESDEENCGPITNVPISTQCLPPNLQCGTKCIPPDQICDSHHDCPNGEDEICKNSTKLKECEFGRCSQLCSLQSANSTLTQCECVPGFKLQSDGVTCKSEAIDEPFLIYTNRYDMRLKRLGENPSKNDFSLDPSEQQSLPLLSHLRNAIALDYYFNRTDGSVLLFWSDISLDQIFRGRLYQGLLDHIEPIISYGVWTAEGIAVDWVGHHIYWIDSQLAHILVSNFDGSMTTTLISGNMQNLRSIAVDPNEGFLFWTDWYEKNPRIESATMAGTNRKTLFNIKPKVVGGGWPNGLVCDFVVKRLYWIDAKSDSVHSIRYDGTDERQILRDPIHLAHPFSITVFDDNFYFSDWKSKNIYKANKWNGSNLQLIIEENINQPFDLKIVHSSRQLIDHNPCENSNCSHLCLIQSSTEFKCACPYLLSLESGSKPRKCVTVNQTLIVATRNSINAIDIDYPNNIVFPLLSATRENITALGIYETKSIIYWADSHSNNIYMLELNSTTQTQPRVFIKSDNLHCFGIAVDNALGQVYYTVQSKYDKSASIRVAGWDGSLQRTILSSVDNPAIRKPREIVYTDGILYFFDKDRIFRCSADGRKLTELKLKPADSNSIQGARSLSIDGTNRLIWTQPSQNVTRVLDPNTMVVQTLRFENNPNASCSLVAVDVFSGEFLFYEDRSGNLSGRYTDENNGMRLKNSTRLLRAGIVNLVDMKLLERDPLSVVDMEDEREQCKRLECDHFCLQSFDERKCKCADGYKTTNQNKCELPSKRLMLLNAEFDFSWLPIDENKTKNSMISIPLLSNSTLQFQARYFVLHQHKIYFIDTKLNELWEHDLYNKQNRLILDGSSARLSSIAIDPNSGYIYVSSYTPSIPLKPMTATIQVLHPTLQEIRKEIYFIVNDTISSMEIDSTQGFIFMINLNGVSRIRLNGSNSTQIINQNRHVSKIALDRQNKRLLYLTMVGNVISSTDYDGKNEKPLPNISSNLQSNQPIIYEALTVNDGMLYFASQKHFHSIELLNGTTGKSRLIANFTSTILGIQSGLIENDKIKSDCISQKCEQFCFYMGSKDRPKCDCVFSRLSKDGRSCENFRSFLAYASGSKIEFTPTFDSQPKDNEVQALRPITSMVKAPVAISSDPKRKLLFVSDILTEQILAISYNQSRRIVLVEHARRVEGMSYDATNQDLYFVSDKSIKRVDLKSIDDTTLPKKVNVVLELDSNDLLRGIAVDPCEQTIYFTNWRVDKPAIEKVYFNGTNRKALITTEIQTPNAIAIDHKSKRLYWLDAKIDKIERMNFEGGSREVVLSSPSTSANLPIWSRGFPAHPFALAVYKNRIYYSDWIHRAIFQLPVHIKDKNITVHRSNMHDQPMGVTIIADDLDVCGTDECSMKKLKCQDKCVLDVEGKAECGCFEGRELDSNSLTCKNVTLKECEKGYLKCDDQKGCYKLEQKCDEVKNCIDGSDELKCVTDPCKDLCQNNGTCISEFGMELCNCDEEFTGFFCQYRKCDGFCVHGQCSINSITGLPQCKCDFGWSGVNCQDKKDLCSQFCKNDGFCVEANNGAHCQCPSNFFGIRCENCHNSISGKEMVCQNDGYCASDRSSCICADGFSGLECEQDVCTDYCLNGGLCKRTKDKTPKCKCLPNYSGDHCEIDFCDLNPDHCLNGGVCVHINHYTNLSANGVKCLCPNQFYGLQCEKERTCSEYCLNGASCTMSSTNEFQCECTNEWHGDRCQHNYGCKLDCAYGECIQLNERYECKCPFGLGLTTDFIGHKSCTKYTATTCSQLTCMNGNCIEIHERNTTYCECEDGWTGMLCDIPNCYNYCARGSECSILDNHAYCKCDNSKFGQRCNQVKSAYSYLLSTPRVNRSWTIMLPLVLLIFAMVIVAYFLALKRHGISFIGVQKQFQHSRMLDDELVANFENPAFSSHEEDNINELISSQLIDTNPYNETVTRTNGSNNNALSRVEQFNLLYKTG